MPRQPSYSPYAGRNFLTRPFFGDPFGAAAAEIAFIGSHAAAAMGGPPPQGRTALIRLSGLLVLATGLALVSAPTAPAIGATWSSRTASRPTGARWC
jgi:hypothetical protein